jgi:hypothetical protein
MTWNKKLRTKNLEQKTLFEIVYVYDGVGAISRYRESHPS